MSQKPINHCRRDFGRGRLIIELGGKLGTNSRLFSDVLSRKGMKDYLENTAKLLGPDESTRITLSSFTVKQKQPGKYVHVQTSPEGVHTVFIWTNNGTQVLTGKLTGKNIFHVDTPPVSALAAETVDRSKLSIKRSQQELQFGGPKVDLSDPRWSRMSDQAKQFRKMLLAALESSSRDSISRTAVDDIAFAVHPVVSEISLARTHWFMPYVRKGIPTIPGAPFEVDLLLLRQNVASDTDEKGQESVVSSDTNHIPTQTITPVQSIEPPCSQEEITMTATPESQPLMPLMELLTQVQGVSVAKDALKIAEQELANEQQQLDDLIRQEEALQAQLDELAKRKSEHQESIDAQRARIAQLSEQSSINIPSHLKEEMRALANAMLAIANQ